MKRIAIAGGGISGLAAAYYLRKTEPSADVRVFEAGPRTGGIIGTVRSPAALMECGPDAFISEKPWALELCRELGLEPGIIPTRSENRRSFILSGGRLLAVPAGFYLTAPRTFQAWKNLPGMSWMGKLRMLGDFFLPAKKGDDDESVAAFVRRRFGRETLEKLAQPMIAGIYTADPENLSLLATFPKFREMEKSYGSILRALVSQKKLKTKDASGPRYSLFLSLKNGMAALTDKLTEELSGAVYSGTAVTALEKKTAGWTVHTTSGAYDAEAVCLALPAYEAAHLLEQSCPELAAQLKEIRFEPVATVNFIFEQGSIRHPLDGFGFVVPAAEKKNLIGCTFSHQKFEGRAAEGKILLRAFAGGAWGRSVFSLSDGDMIKAILSDLKEILGIEKPPVSAMVSRYPQGMPQYETGHAARIAGIREAAARIPGLFLTGNSYSGIGIPDCIHAAHQTAQQILLHLA